MNAKTTPGNYFEDFRLEQAIVHATPRTLTDGDAALYTALYGSRFAVNSSSEFAASLGLPGAPLDSLLVFHVVFGKTVADISLNAVANLGYASGRFGQPVYAGDTLSATSKVVGLKQNKNGKTGIVYVRSTGVNQRGETVVDYVRWVMTPKRDPDAPAPATFVPDLPAAVDAGDLVVPFPNVDLAYDTVHSGSPYLWDDYQVGERIDHVDGITIEETDHMLAARLYQNSARVHFNQHAEQDGRFGRRIVYGGHVLSLARALSFNGLANALNVAAINGGRHANPVFAGDTIYAWSEVLDKTELVGRPNMGALRIRTVAVKNQRSDAFAYQDATGAYEPSVALDFDYVVSMPRR